MNINLDKIFSVFDDENVKDLKGEFLNNYICQNIKNYNNYILNFDILRAHLNISLMILNPEGGKNFNKENQRFIFYMKSFLHLKKIDELFESESKDKNILKKFINEEFIQASELLLKYFEEKELYEYCAIVKIYLDLGKIFLKKDLAI